MSDPISISLNTFLSAAEAASSDSRTVKLSGNSAKAVWYHTFQSTNHKAMTEFISAIGKEYGQDIANIASRKLRNELTDSKPLTAGLIKSTMTEIQKHSHKQLARDLFLMGMDAETGMASTQTGFSVTFEKNYKHLEDSLGILSPDIHEILKKEVYEQFTAHFKNVENHICSQEEMENFINSASIFATLSSLETHGVLKLPGSADDKVSIVLTLTQHGILSAPGFALQKLADIRSQFPEGPLSMEQIWQGCFNSEMPTVSEDPDALDEAFNDNVAQYLEVPDFPGAKNSCLNLTSVMPLSTIIQFATGQLNNITLDNFFAPPKVTFSPYSSISGLEALNKDVHRVFASMPYPKSMGKPTHKVDPYIHIGKNDAVMIGIKTKQNIRQAITNTINQEVLAICTKSNEQNSDKVDAEQNTVQNTRQADSILHLCTQSSLSQFFGSYGLFSGGGSAPFRHMIVSEHNALWTEIQPQENGDVTVVVKTPDNAPDVIQYIGNFSSTITVHSDGSCEYTEFNLQLTAPIL